MKKTEKEKKELEKKIEEEQKKLCEKKNKDKKKEKKPEKKKKDDKDLSEKVNVKKDGKDDLHKKIDYHKFLEHQLHKLDYSNLFSYLNDSVKKPEYEYSIGESDSIRLTYRKEETIAWQDIQEVTDETKMEGLMGVNRSFVMNEKKEAYKWWKVFNKALGEFLYDVSMT